MSHYFSPASIVKILCVVALLPHTLHSHEVTTHKSSKHGGKSRSHRQLEDGPPIFVAHRGDKALIPEHTIPAYDQAMLENVDFVEPDLMMTKDQVLVCHHDITLRAGTDVSSKREFAAMMRKNVTLFLDGKNVTILDDWLIPDFTYHQLKTLKVYQANSGLRPQHFNGFFRIPTFQEYIDTVHKYTWRRRTFNPNETFVMGMIPEIKYPDYHNSIFNVDHLMETIFIGELRMNGYLEEPPSCKYDRTEIPCSPMVVQCFDVKTIKYLHVTTHLRLLTLLDTQNLRYLTYDGMAELANETEFLGIWKEHLFTGTQAEVDYDKTPYDPAEIRELGGFVEPDKIVDYAHELGMKVGIYTIYQSFENSSRGCAKQCVNDTKEMELNYYFDLGVDAFFVEGICESLRIRDKYFQTRGEGSLGKSFIGKWTQITGSLVVAIWTMSMRM